MNPICNSVHVRVPATSANLGSGFDTVGLALDYHDELTFTLNDDPNDGIAHVIIHGEGADALPCDETHLVVSTFRRACATFGLGRLGFTLEATNNIPQARGMGSSAEAIVAGIAAAAALVKEKWGSVDVLVHTVAFANREDLTKRFNETSRDGFATALNVSA